MEGAPALSTSDEYKAWSAVFQREFEALRADLAARRPTLLNPYAATSPPEFFAVVTEFFFERPAELRARHPDLYQQMRLFFKQDPAERFIACYGHDPAPNAEPTPRL
jgi:Mlc titration factor MtfA (ptsG expression regulator)